MPEQPKSSKIGGCSQNLNQWTGRSAGTGIFCAGKSNVKLFNCLFGSPIYEFAENIEFAENLEFAEVGICGNLSFHKN